MFRYQKFDLNAHNNVPVLAVLNDTVIARWFRLVVTAVQSYARLTMELYGRPHGTTKQLTTTKHQKKTFLLFDLK